jgi:hypothetical protein
MALKQILEDVSAEVSDVGVIVDRRPAGIHADESPLRIKGREGFHLTGVRIEKLDGHEGRTKGGKKNLRAKPNRKINLADGWDGTSAHPPPEGN